MSYLRGMGRTGVGAIATSTSSGISSTTSRVPEITSRSTLMLAVPEPMTVGKPTVITPGVKVVRVAAQPDNIIVRVRRPPAPGIETLREAKLFAGTPASSQPTGPDLQIGTGIGTPVPRTDKFVSDPVPARVLTAPEHYVGSGTPLVSIAPPAPLAPPMVEVDYLPPATTPVPTASTTSKLPWIIVGGGLLAYLLLKD